jgi:integrase
MIEHYINPMLGDFALRSIRTEHVDHLYADLLSHGGRSGHGLAPKTVHEVHMIIPSALDDAVDSGLLRTNAATKARPPRSQSRPRTGPTTWSAEQLGEFLSLASRHRLYPALHLAASTGMRRGEIAGLRWSDWNQHDHRLSVNRTRQVVAGRSTEFAPKTQTSRRCVDLDATTEARLHAWRHRQLDESLPAGADDPIFTNKTGQPLNAESISHAFPLVEVA